ncbi:MAG: hypothetical protein HN411_05695 [Waddliaceae bacterium]|jgi:protein arginine kinase activator|nr:hypothetical protein [Waddliaceae bacterium]MBT3579510.1 hypothetical protein [Waddliaceae bacterium]MBT4444999.1 hypothetical protein [Waddliaceae bacterium]MBT6928266.1 hypothetical protein [Waddliaceae bacterium]MBT7264215.1 hypothetical protein [Waddliaceae bacterium]
MNVERPLECSGCNKPHKVFYTQVVGDKIHRVAMCESCPSLQHKNLDAVITVASTDKEGAQAELCCGACGTTLEEVRCGSPLGCAGCYDIFGDIIIAAASPKGKTIHKTMMTHIGRALGKTDKMKPLMTLVALNEALEETLGREDYEQAAWIRDQIEVVKKKKEEDPNADASHLLKKSKVKARSKTIKDKGI